MINTRGIPMESKKVEQKVENKSPLKVEEKKLNPEELKNTKGGSWTTSMFISFNGDGGSI